jgi:hypothetical protein
VPPAVFGEEAWSVRRSKMTQLFAGTAIGIAPSGCPSLLRRESC